MWLDTVAVVSVQNVLSQSTGKKCWTYKFSEASERISSVGNPEAHVPMMHGVSSQP
jgi:hypothetical protein